MLPQQSDGRVNIRRGDQAEVHCTESFREPFESRNNLLIRCFRNQTFLVDGKRVQFNELTCSSYPDHIARRTGRTCNNGTATLAEIGFVLQNKRFMWIMNVCVNENIENTYYTQYRLGPANNGHQRSFARPSFIVGDFFSKDLRRVNTLYTRRMQRVTFGRLLGEAAAAPLFNETLYVFLARGHMMAKADNIFGAHQRGTFYYINVAPQWQSFNAGNWLVVENAVREYVAKQQLNVQVYTGTYGVLSLPDCGGYPVEIYLDINNSTHNNCSGHGPIPNEKGRLPVPLFYYKIVLDLNDKRGVVFIGLNNPHATVEEIRLGKYDLCPDVSDRITWMENKWNRTNILTGYSYACDVNSFVKAVDHLPRSIRATALLI